MEPNNIIRVAIERIPETSFIEFILKLITSIAPIAAVASSIAAWKTVQSNQQERIKQIDLAKPIIEIESIHAESGIFGDNINLVFKFVNVRSRSLRRLHYAIFEMMGFENNSIRSNCTHDTISFKGQSPSEFDIKIITSLTRYKESAVEIVLLLKAEDITGNLALNKFIVHYSPDIQRMPNEGLSEKITPLYLKPRKSVTFNNQLGLYSINAIYHKKILMGFYEYFKKNINSVLLIFLKDFHFVKTQGDGRFTRLIPISDADIILSDQLSPYQKSEKNLKIFSSFPENGRDALILICNKIIKTLKTD